LFYWYDKEKDRDGDIAVVVTQNIPHFFL
jgi:hypothetical protein